MKLLYFTDELDGPLKFSTAIGTEFMPVESVSLADQVRTIFYFAFNNTKMNETP